MFRFLYYDWFSRWLGNRGEREAARFLKTQGHKILARQYRNRLGELDLITEDQGTIVFVEVKTRSDHRKGEPEQAVELRKQRQLTRVALSFLKQQGWLERRCRFDVIAVVMDRGRTEIRHFKNAFEPGSFGQFYS